ncbi:MAG TPA: hypothetical protein PL064_13520, partial [Thermogutta sp.]|nr:hypothetical protein [Thermogutta sp.]
MINETKGERSNGKQEKQVSRRDPGIIHAGTSRGDIVVYLSNWRLAYTVRDNNSSGLDKLNANQGCCIGNRGGDCSYRGYRRLDLSAALPQNDRKPGSLAGDPGTQQIFA